MGGYYHKLEGSRKPSSFQTLIWWITSCSGIFFGCKLVISLPKKIFITNEEWLKCCWHQMFADEWNGANQHSFHASLTGEVHLHYYGCVLVTLRECHFLNLKLLPAGASSVELMLFRIEACTSISKYLRRFLFYIQSHLRCKCSRPSFTKMRIDYDISNSRKL